MTLVIENTTAYRFTVAIDDDDAVADMVHWLAGLSMRGRQDESFKYHVKDGVLTASSFEHQTINDFSTRIDHLLHALK